ncbi:MAG: SH3 domain-containing protein [Devosia sp.]
MPNPLSALIPGSLVLRSGLVAATFLTVPLLVTAAQSLQCGSPAHWGACPEIVVEAPAIESTQIGQAEIKVAAVEPPSPERDAMLDATFSALEPAAALPPVDNTRLVAAVEQPIKPLEPAMPATRVVKTTTIRANTAPVLQDIAPLALAEAPAETPKGEALTAIDEAAPADVVAEQAVVEPAAKPEPVKAEPVAKAKVVARTEPAKAVTPKTKKAAASNTRKVAGQGVNVRSGAGKSKGKLFALPGGSVVTVLEDDKGWLKITDSQGRTGWIYKDYLV